MGDHLWPALYPGLIVGFLYGLSLRGVSNIVLGMLGGLVGAAISLAVPDAFHGEQPLVPLIMLVVLALAGAVAGCWMGSRVLPQKRQ